MTAQIAGTGTGTEAAARPAAGRPAAARPAAARNSRTFRAGTRLAQVKARRGVVTALALAVLALAVLAAGCGSVSHQAAAPARRPMSLPLATSLAAGQATWAVVPMGAAAGANRFWQLFLLPAGSPRWKLVTPPDVATNGAIALGVAGGQSLVAGIHPSLLLRFSPVTSTPDGGRTWSADTPEPGLANVPDALGTAPRGGELIALGNNGNAELARVGHAAWKALASTRVLAGTAAARACQLAGLSAAAFEPAGLPALAGTCGRPGVAGIFTYAGGTWHAAGPPLPAALRQQLVRVIRLTRTGGRLTALLQAGTGHSASLRAAWMTGGRWTLSAPLRLTSPRVASSSFGSDGAVAVELAGGRGEVLAGPGSSWQALPALPPGRAVTLALPTGGGVDALAADGGLLTAWRLSGPPTGDGAAWAQTQQIRVPIQYGSSS